MFRKRAGDERRRRKRNQITTSWTKETHDAGAATGKKRQAKRAFDQVSNHRRRAQTRSEQSAGQEHCKTLPRDRHWSNLNRKLRARRDEQTKNNHQPHGTRRVERRERRSHQCVSFSVSIHMSLCFVLCLCLSLQVQQL